MSDENIAEPTPEIVPSLDDVISEFDVTPDFTPEQAPYQAPYQPEAAPQPQVAQTIDPFDEGQMSNFVQNNQNQFGSMQQQLDALNQQAQSRANTDYTAKQSADVQSAVEMVNKIAGHENPKWIEFQIQQAAENNAGFMKMWENRDSNPKAFNKALTALGNEFKKGTTETLSDPQLVENQRAANLSQQNINSGSPEVTGLESRLEAATSDADFSRIWNQSRMS